ncbi:hypothetical protein MYSTI_01960 [Myxococcus stipitatus DSM 14675]|uniref:Uncharacterized protein n=1 Tax=Myxococcus stipitatus (strain DSM 14675 / JCM 12634 / Mx s8) TaxID=1278073 RepID=L7U9Z8_MYXSD|nr:hypothetical protein [Myxococcus stipitatus]AGC43289.1 hypothetical protein MYSTI_01960 [Myxococcus stipitatus DSM 14675]
MKALLVFVAASFFALATVGVMRAMCWLSGLPPHPEVLVSVAVGAGFVSLIPLCVYFEGRS